MTKYKAKAMFGGIPAMARGIQASLINPDRELQDAIAEKNRYLKSINDPNVNENQKNLLRTQNIPMINERIQLYTDAQKDDSYESRRLKFESTVDASEKLRKLHDARMLELIENDTDLQGQLRWLEDEPVDHTNWMKPQLMLRSFNDLSISMGAMFLTGQVATRSLQVTGKALKYADLMLDIKKADKAKKGGALYRGSKAIEQTMIPYAGKTGILTMMLMEGSGIYNDTVKNLQEEYGLSPEEAIPLGAAAAALYGPGSGVLESLQVFKAAKYLNISTDQIQKSYINKLITNLTKNIGPLGSPQFTKAWKKGGYELLDMGSNSLEEAYVESFQGMYEELVSEAVKQGYGLTPESAVNGLIAAAQAEEGTDAWAFALPGVYGSKEQKEIFWSTFSGSLIPSGTGKVANATGIMKYWEKWKENGGDVKVDSDGKIELRDSKTNEKIILNTKFPDQRADEIKKNTNAEVTITKKDYSKDPITNEDYANTLIKQITTQDYESTLLAEEITGKKERNINLNEDTKGRSALEKMIIGHGKKIDPNFGRKALDLMNLAGDKDIFNKIAAADPSKKEAVDELYSYIAMEIQQTTTETLSNKDFSKSKVSKQDLMDAFMSTLQEKSQDDILDAFFQSKGQDDFISMIAEDKAIDKVLKAKGRVVKTSTKKSSNNIKKKELGSVGAATVINNAKENTQGYNPTGNINNDTKKNASKQLDKIIVDAHNSDDSSKNVINALEKANKTTLKKLHNELKIPYDSKKSKEQSKNDIAAAVTNKITTVSEKEVIDFDPTDAVNDPLKAISVKGPPKTKTKAKTKKKAKKGPISVTPAQKENAEATIELEKEFPGSVTKQELEKAKKIAKGSTATKKPISKKKVVKKSEDPISEEEIKTIKPPKGAKIVESSEYGDESDTRKPEDVFDVFDDKSADVIRFGGETITREEFNKLNKEAKEKRDVKELRDDLDDDLCIGG
jgi:hypothetical protein